MVIKSGGGGGGVNRQYVTVFL